MSDDHKDELERLRKYNQQLAKELEDLHLTRARDMSEWNEMRREWAASLEVTARMKKALESIAYSQQLEPTHKLVFLARAALG